MKKTILIPVVCFLAVVILALAIFLPQAAKPDPQVLTGVTGYEDITGTSDVEFQSVRGLVLSVTADRAIIQPTREHRYIVNDMGLSETVEVDTTGANIGPSSISLSSGQYVECRITKCEYFDSTVMNVVADEVIIMARRGETAVQTGTVVEILDETDEKLKFSVETEAGLSVFNLPRETAAQYAEVRPGVKVSAITRGTHSVHQPPQWQVIELLIL